MTLTRPRSGPRAALLALAAAAMLALPVLNVPAPAEALPLPAPGSPVPLIALEHVAGGFVLPLGYVHAGDGSGRMFVVEQIGRVYQMNPDGSRELYLDVRGKVSCCGERGLLGVAFAPDFEDSGRLYISYTRAGDGASVLSRLVVGGDPATGKPDASGEEVLLVQSQPFGNHNGGNIAFSPVDGYLYYAIGDGGAGGDPFNNAQNPANLLGKMMRLDVSGATGYAVPPTNPYAQVPGYRAEIWAFGLRNPWRWSFDSLTGDLWIGDVGQNVYEEVNHQPAAWPGGANYMWRCMEGLHRYTDCGVPAVGVPVAPVLEYSHAVGGCSVTGGYAYRGAAIPALQGTYLYGDFCSGKIWVALGAGPARVGLELMDSSVLISSFGEDPDGEVYVVHLGGSVWKVVAA